MHDTGRTIVGRTGQGDDRGGSPAAASQAVADGHHSGEGRNIVTTSPGQGGHDIFFAAVQMTRMPMVLSDPNLPDNPIIFCNHAFRQMTGYEEHEVLGRNCRFMQGPDTDPAAIARVHDAIARGEDVAEELFNYRRDGSGFWNALFISPVFDADGRLKYFFGSQIDVTRRKEAEAVLQQSQRMETLGAMASGVAHEFNNLMTVVLASVEQAQDRARDPRQHEQLERAAWGARRAGRLTQQMLSFARRQFLDAQAADLNEMVLGLDSILAQVGPRGGAGLRFALAAEKLPVQLDPGQFEMALINLVRNAADATQEGGEVTIASSVLQAGGRGWAELRVIDSGTGMHNEVIRRAVEPFFTTKARGHGAGLGLSMVQGFATQSGGELAIESEVGKGTTVRLRFPLRRNA
jgi:PAS domain S-box-containing protein